MKIATFENVNKDAYEIGSHFSIVQKQMFLKWY